MLKFADQFFRVGKSLANKDKVWKKHCKKAGFFNLLFVNCNKCITSEWNFFFGSQIFSNLVCSQNGLITEWKVSKLSCVSLMSFMGTALFLHFLRQARFLLIPYFDNLETFKIIFSGKVWIKNSVWPHFAYRKNDCMKTYSFWLQLVSSRQLRQYEPVQVGKRSIGSHSEEA